MSAYIVATDTIDLLVAAADRWRLTFPDRDGTNFCDLHACSHRNEAGQLLMDENERSVNHRYDYRDKPARRYSYTPIDLDRAAVGMPVAVLVLGSVRCLRYQSCETADYATTRAAVFLDRIEAEACRKLISTHEAPWGFTRDWMNTKIAEVKAKVAANVAAH
jgi:hypothetical protein